MDMNCFINNSNYNFVEMTENNYVYDEAMSKEHIIKYLKNGPYVYKLFAIVIHSGSFSGGHYYAYIKSFEDDKWYNFNDKDVYEIDSSDIELAYGNDDCNGVSLNTGYMLMYKQCTEQYINSQDNSKSNISSNNNHGINNHDNNKDINNKNHDINNNDINNKRCNNNNHNTINELSIDINHINNSNNSHTNENSNLNSTNNSNNNHNNHNNHNTNHKSIKKISDLNIKKDLFYIIQEENEKIEEEEERKRRDKCKIINVELIHNNILKSIPVKENTLVKAFKIQVLKAYNLDNIHPSNVRLKSSFKNNQNECTYFLSDNMVINIHNSLL